MRKFIVKTEEDLNKYFDSIVDGDGSATIKLPICFIDTHKLGSRMWHKALGLTKKQLTNIIYFEDGIVTDNGGLPCNVGSFMPIVDLYVRSKNNSNFRFSVGYSALNDYLRINKGYMTEGLKLIEQELEFKKEEFNNFISVNCLDEKFFTAVDINIMDRYRVLYKELQDFNKYVDSIRYARNHISDIAIDKLVLFDDATRGFLQTLKKDAPNSYIEYKTTYKNIFSYVLKLQNENQVPNIILISEYRVLQSSIDAILKGVNFLLPKSDVDKVFEDDGKKLHHS